MSDRLLKRPDFAGVHGVPVKGDAEPALKRGDGDDHAMGLGLIHGTHSPANTPTENPYLIGMLPAELGMHMDMATAVSVRSADTKDATAFIQFATLAGDARRVEGQRRGPLLKNVMTRNKGENDDEEMAFGFGAVGSGMPFGTRDRAICRAAAAEPSRRAR